MNLPCSVIIPAFNLADLTVRCLQVVLSSDPAEVIVVDDASSDHTSPALARFGDRITTIVHPENTGFARSCNDGAAVAQSPFLVFLNNDTLPREGCLHALVRYAEEHAEADVVGSKLLFPDDTIQHAGVVIGQDRYPRHVYAGFPANHPAVCRSRRFQVVTAACMLVRREVFIEAGGFDTAFRNGFEDVDFCLRVGERGREIHYCAESVLYHLESVSPGRFGQRRNNVELYRQRWMERVRPDDLGYYAQDGLLNIHYEGKYPLTMEISPLLAVMDGEARHAALERQLLERSRHVNDLQRENIRLRAELGDRAGDSPELCYRKLKENIAGSVARLADPGSVVLVVSNGDGALLELGKCRGWHFPRDAHGAYAGHHPADSADAIKHLDDLRAEGARYFLLPRPSLWWLDHYADFARHLDRVGRRLDQASDSCALFDMGESGRAGS